MGKNAYQNRPFASREINKSINLNAAIFLDRRSASIERDNCAVNHLWYRANWQINRVRKWIHSSSTKTYNVDRKISSSYTARRAPCTETRPRKLGTRSIFCGERVIPAAHDRTYSWIPSWLSEHGAPSSRKIVLEEQRGRRFIVAFREARAPSFLPATTFLLTWNQAKNMTALLAVATSRSKVKSLKVPIRSNSAVDPCPRIIVTFLTYYVTVCFLSYMITQHRIKFLLSLYRLLRECQKHLLA